MFFFLKYGVNESFYINCGIMTDDVKDKHDNGGVGTKSPVLPPHFVPRTTLRTMGLNCLFLFFEFILTKLMSGWKPTQSIWNQATGSAMEDLELEEKTHSPPLTPPTALGREPWPSMLFLQQQPMQVDSCWPESSGSLNRILKRNRSPSPQPSEHVATLDEEGNIICPKCAQEVRVLFEEEEEFSDEDPEWSSDEGSCEDPFA
nr:hypothetical protein [Cressdnaviricota sp.]